jgi:hypothetical protein
MQVITAPISRDEPRENRAAIVTDLQEGLLLLLRKRAIQGVGERQQSFEDGLQREQRDQAYNDITQQLVRMFQEQYRFRPELVQRFSLTVTGNVDAATATALNTILRELGAFDTPQAEWTVCGQVVDANGPLNDLQVSVFDRDLFFRRGGANTGQPLGNGTTKKLPTKNEDGWFEFVFATADFAAGDEPVEGVTTPDLVFALSRDGQPLEKFQIYRLPDGKEVAEETLVSDDDLIMGIQARRVEEVRIVIEGGEQKRQLSEYEQLILAIEPLLPERAPANADAAQREALEGAALLRFD